MEAKYEIPAANLPRFEKRIQKLIRVAEKLEVPPVSYSIGPARAVQRTIMDVPDGRVVKYTVHDVTVSGEAPKLNGWRFAATLQHTEEGLILRTVPGEPELGPFYRSKENEAALRRCDHCLMDRRRKDTFVVRQDTDGKLDERVIGRSCLRDFLGHRDPHKIADYAELLASFASDAANYEDIEAFGQGFRAEPAVDIVTFLAACNRRIRADGFFISWKWLKEQEEKNGGYPDGRTATSVGAWADLDPEGYNHGRDRETYVTKKAGAINDDDREYATSALAWVAAEYENKSAEEISEFEHNLKVACASDFVTFRTKGIVAALLPTYRRAMKSRAPAPASPSPPAQAARPPSEWFGIVGETAEFTLRVTDVREITTDFGPMNLVSFEDASGNVAKTFTKNAKFDVKPSEWVVVKAKVKSHGEYRGVKETMLSTPRIAKGK